MDEGVKRIPPDMQPSDDGGSIGSVATNKRNDNIAVIVVGIILVLVFGAAIWAISTLGPPIQGWVDNKINPEPTAMLPTERIIACYDDCPEVACPEPEVLECPVLVCPGCEPCPTTPDAQITDNREGIDNYLLKADEVLVDMEASIALMDEVSHLMWSFGNTRGEQKSAFNDAQWNGLLEDADNKVEVVRYKLDQIWPPGPYNSCNTILDAHARMLLAFVNIDEARDNMLEALNERSVDKMAYFYSPHIDDARVNIDLARLQLAKVR